MPIEWLYFELDALMLLNAADDVEQVSGVGIPVWPEHAHEALLRPISMGSELLETDGRVDVERQYDLARIDVSEKQKLDAFLQQFLSKGWVASGSCLHRLFEVTRLAVMFQYLQLFATPAILPKLTGICRNVPLRRTLVPPMSRTIRASPSLPK